MDQEPDFDAARELEVMKQTYALLTSLGAASRHRVFSWLADAAGITLRFPPSALGVGAAEPLPRNGDGSSPPFGSFADLFSHARPSTNGEKALVGAYWLQVIQGASDFTSQSINNELKNLGEAVANITAAFDDLIEAKPQLVLQLRKSGTSRQARKKFKITKAGEDAVLRQLQLGSTV